jgi:hypothetical protein
MFLAGVQELERSGFPPKACGNDVSRLLSFVLTPKVMTGMTFFAVRDVAV